MVLWFFHNSLYYPLFAEAHRLGCKLVHHVCMWWTGRGCMHYGVNALRVCWMVVIYGGFTESLYLVARDIWTRMKDESILGFASPGLGFFWRNSTHEFCFFLRQNSGYQDDRAFHCSESVHQQNNQEKQTFQTPPYPPPSPTPVAFTFFFLALWLHTFLSATASSSGLAGVLSQLFSNLFELYCR